ncbi:amidohydrolase family protein [Enterovibrio sp. ZSDZ35]|uniref:Amidohydrolase family protein n=1 Tax=Enterovibrio qingdaonensis TaxID=2899818 RepID=A0ABT5QJX6_9GAMM|nr:amidohydrolase family protein [Enterovibrio sp. ZSDZ35]MDD1781288.1 amidohydrolase family protein [Enterovibrio sp. ZSDZ35]
MKIIDPHLHLFSLEDGNYGWLKPQNPPFWTDKTIIHRDFHEKDLSLDSPLALTGFVHVEAGFDNAQPWREIEWLEASCYLPFKSIACVDLTLPQDAFAVLVDKLTQYQTVVGVRHILDDDAVRLLNLASVQDNLRTLAENNLIFEAQFDANDTQAVEAFFDTTRQHADLQFVLNHAGFPPSENDKPWEINLQRLSKSKNLWVKASGWEMSDRHFSVKTMLERINALIACLGEERVMLASNFPLTLFRTTYSGLWADYLALPYSEMTLKKLCFENANQCYRF